MANMTKTKEAIYENMDVDINIFLVKDKFVDCRFLFCQRAMGLFVILVSQ